jgi:hypothetical protein
MTPAYEGDPELPKVVPKERWYTTPAARSSDVPGESPDGRRG